MNRARRYLQRLLNTLRPGRGEADLARELAGHAALLEAEYCRRGMTPDEARRCARLALGGIEQTKERHRDARSFRWLNDVRRDSWYAARLFRRNPVFAATAAMSLAIGIGASTTVFTAANTLLLRTAPGVADPDRLIDINRTGEPIGVELLSRAQYVEIRDRATLVQGVYAYDLNLTPLSLTGLPGQSVAEPVFGSVVSANYFTTLGVEPSAGRVFVEQDTGPVVVLSHRFWRRRFDTDAAVIGRTLRLNERSYLIVGIARESFHGTTVLAPDLWMPADRVRPLTATLVGARLKPGIPLSRAAAEIEAIGRTLHIDSALPDFNEPGGLARKAGLSASRSSPIPTGVRLLVAGFLGLLMAIVAVVLVIACANVAAVLLARATARRREIAIRLALGVGRARLLRQLLTETLLLFALGGAGGLALSRAMNAAILRVLPSFPIPADVSLAQDGRVFAFAMGISFLTAIVFGLTPALEASKVDVISVLKADEYGPARSVRLRRAFVVSEIALSVLLVIVGGLLSRALGRAGTAQRGFDPRGVEVAAIDLSLGGYSDANGPSFARDLLDRVQKIPGVEAAAIAYASPAGGAMGFQISVPGTAPRGGQPYFDALGNLVTPGYFSAMRMDLAAGRDFAATDSAGRDRVAIVSETSVRKFWPGISNQDAIGRQILLQPMLIDTGTRRRPAGMPLTVVGVARDLFGVNGTAPRPFVYVPLQQQYMAAVKLLVRTADGHRIADQLRSAVNGLDARLPILSVGALEDEAGPVVTQLRIASAIAATLGIVGGLLAAVGIYGLTAFIVTWRTREIGVRVALGAERPHLIRLVLGEGMRLVAIGSAAGLVLAAGASRLLTHLLFGVPPLDPLTYGGTVLLFGTVGLVACYVPLRRALGINPVEALRYE